MLGILIWSVHHAGGTAGPYFAHDYKTDTVLANSIRKYSMPGLKFRPGPDVLTAWAVIYGATSVLGNMGTVTLGQANWCRLSKIDNKRSMVVQVISLLIFTYTVCEYPGKRHGWKTSWR